MSEPTPTPTDAPADESGAATAPPAEPTKRTLESSLAGLDDDTRAFVIGQVTKARSEAKNLRDRLTVAEPKATEFERLAAANKTAEERQADELARAQSEADRWRRTSVGSRIEAIAAADFADPSDAVGALDPATYIGDDGSIDEAAMRTDLAALLERKPHWRRPEGSTARVPAPNAHQGSGANGKAAADPAAELAAILQGQLRGPG